MRLGHVARYLSSAALSAACARALKLHTPKKWNVEHVNVLTWDYEASDPADFSVELRHPWFIHGSLAILSAVNKVDGGALVWLPILPKSNLYHMEAVEVGDITKVLTRSKNFTIVTDTSAAPAFTLTMAPHPPQNISPAPQTSLSDSSIPTSRSTSALPSSTPSLSFNGAPTIRHAARSPRVVATLVHVMAFAWMAL
ncbi:hypothetical protein AURDEDRAFT_113376 [Auricularia subglabra TFB-10046 SS5]|nr:hypothetical protein AURDEDRAFT_113376 [Auricularia subglabra TFB-10046 SS5]